MKTIGCAILALAAASAAWAQDRGFTKDDVLKLQKAGIGDEVILAKINQEKRTVSISADDLAELKQAGVGEKVLARLAELTKRAGPPAGSKPVVLRNLSHRGVKVAVNTEDRLIDFSMASGTDLPSGGSLELAAPAGAYAIAIEGRPTTERVLVPDSGSCSLTVRGADTSYIDLQTIVAEDADGRRVVILHSEGKSMRVPGRHAVVAYGDGHCFSGPDMSLFPFVSDTVLLGAGVGAIIGHQSGHRTRGALIGAGAGFLLDRWTWR
ncbi:MAG TPA: glycine zipper family protein [Planctomycetota bacterium]|nr:glycine zipper family protein [Planctomycetota bacterium]